MLEALVAELRRAHGAHTVILYGSHARGDATAESDVDVAAFAEVARTLRDARAWHGTFLDGFVYPTAVATAEALDGEMLKLVGGRVLADDRGLAAPLLARLAALEAAAPEPAPEDHRQMLRMWAHKTLARARRGDVEAHYRRHWLLYQLLEDHFTLRGLRYRGPKLALAELRTGAPATYAAFERALAPGAGLDELAALVDVVIGPT
ncbi:MAG: nucleotidyltransferase domain-containing protein [Deltaproteobacteria bacterium]|nr:nucleotidyltransferase domain-containing protein [Deltaproteobacteria bacterium]MCW5809113.1 nucleotidyltransferase domain-containing protein [Deltaproteobacteria bacterium]